MGGEKRLNVAVTRAKYNIRVVTSIHASDIRLEKTDSLGVQYLKEYLDYAEHIQTKMLPKQPSYDGVLESVCRFWKIKGIYAIRWWEHRILKSIWPFLIR